MCIVSTRSVCDAAQGEEGLQDPLAATVDAEVTADDAAQSEEKAGQQSAGNVIKAEDTVNTGSQHVIKVNLLPYLQAHLACSLVDFVSSLYIIHGCLSYSVSSGMVYMQMAKFVCSLSWLMQVGQYTSDL